MTFCHVVVVDWWPKGWSTSTIWTWPNGSQDKTSAWISCENYDCFGGYMKQSFTNSYGVSKNPGTVTIDFYVNGSFVRRDFFTVA